MIRELLYLSEAKVQRVLFNAGEQASQANLSWNATAKLPLVGSVEVSGQTVDVDDNARLANDLERVLAYLAGVDNDITEPSLTAHQWVNFDLELAYGTACRDDYCRGNHPDFCPTGHKAPDDVALFVGEVPADEVSDARGVSVLMCGSVKHLRDRVSTLDRMGSDTDWIHDMVTTLYEREKRGIVSIPESLTDIVPRTGVASPEQQAHTVYGVASRNHPPSQRGRLRGLARVLMNIDDPAYETRLIVATPLYVEIPPPTPLPVRKRWWEKLLNRP